MPAPWAAEERDAPTKVPRNSCGSKKRNEMPVAAPDDFAIAAVIKPNPLFDKEKIRTSVT
ncbi:MAG: hypothetical protein ACPLKZ_07560 [Candidatus Bathyarchaeales archaeon]